MFERAFKIVFYPIMFANLIMCVFFYMIVMQGNYSMFKDGPTWKRTPQQYIIMDCIDVANYQMICYSIMFVLLLC